MADTPTELEPLPEPAPKRRSPLLYVAGILAVLALVAGVVIVASDGDGGGTDDPVALLTSAPDAARDAGSARMTMSISMEGGGVSMSLDGEGLVDFETGAGSFEMSMMGFDLRVLSDGETVWMQLPNGGVDGKTWVSMPADTVQGQQLGGVGSATGMLEALRGIGAEEIQDLGDEEVNGVQARHYSTVVDLAAAIENAPEATRDEARAALEQLEGLGDAGFPIDAWISEDGLPVRMVMTFSPPEGEAASLLGDFDMRLQTDMVDFGAPVEIDPPDPSEVREITDPAEIEQLLGGGGLFGGGPAELPAD